MTTNTTRFRVSRCKGLCDLKYKVTREGRPPYTSLYSYSKLCSICSVRVDIKYRVCPCCNVLLRSQPRKAESKRKLILKQKNAKKKIKAPQI